jgi:hypothetical protein
MTSAVGGRTDVAFKRDHFRFRHKADLENVAQPAASEVRAGRLLRPLRPPWVSLGPTPPTKQWSS